MKTKSTISRPEPVRRYCVIREGEESYVPRHLLTAAELADVEERSNSPEARRRFGTLLRKVRQAEDAPSKAAIKLLRAKVAAGEPEELTDGELEPLLRNAPEHVKDSMYRMNRRERPTAPGGREGDMPRRLRAQDRPASDTK
jgi:hypothetical protein